MRKVVAAGALARSHISSAPPHIFLVLPSLVFAPLCQLAPPPDSFCIFHSPGHCRGRTFRTVLWSVALEVLGVGSVLGWRALVQDLLLELPLHPYHFAVFPPPGIACLLHLFGRFLSRHLPGSAGADFSLRVWDGSWQSLGRVTCRRCKVLDFHYGGGEGPGSH